MLAFSSNLHQTVINQPSSSAISSNPSMPLKESSQPHSNQTNIHLTPINSLSPQNPALWSHNPRSKTPTQDTSSPDSTPTVKLDLPIETTLNALSLFQKPILLFSATQSPITSLTPTNSSLVSNYVDTSTNSPTQNSQNESPVCEVSNPTATIFPNHIFVPAKASSFTKKTNQNFPLQHKTSKKAILTSTRKNILNSFSTYFPHTSSYEEKIKNF